MSPWNDSFALPSALKLIDGVKLPSAAARPTKVQLALPIASVLNPSRESSRFFNTTGHPYCAVAPGCTVNVKRASTPLPVGHAFALETATEIAPFWAAKSAADVKLQTVADPDGTRAPSWRAAASSSRRASVGYSKRNEAPETALVWPA